MNDEKAVAELQTAIDAIDFSGGLAPVSSTPATPEQKPTEETPSTPTTPAESDASEKETPVVAETPAEKPAEEVVESTPVKSEESPAEDRPAIPDSHYRAALHMGMKAEEVGELYDQNPALALKTLAKCYEMINASSKQLGELGQRARQLKEQSPAAPQVTDDKTAKFMAGLKEKYADDPIVDLVGELLKGRQPEPRAETRPQPVQSDPQVEIERQVAVRQQINTFFTADEMNAYDDFYGKTSQTGDWQALTPGQRANRIEVCNRAQLVLDGAAMTGMQMSAAEAMERAHLEVAAPLAEQFIRERIVKSVTRRAKGATLKPSGSKTPASAAGSYNKETAIQEVGALLKQLG
jgi:hypothetical protein